MTKQSRWGDGSVRQVAPGVWRVRIRDHGRRVSRNFRSKVEAERWKAETLAAKARGEEPQSRRPATDTLETLAAAWLKRRETTHRSWSDDRGRWRHHLAPTFGRLRPGAVDVATVRAYVERRVQAGDNHDSIRLAVACLSSLFTDLCERPRETGVTVNPCRMLPKTLRRLFRSEHDSRFTPYVEALGEVGRIYREMVEPQRIGYAVGVVAGLRPGEILALRWEHVHDGERIDVREQAQDGRVGPLKDDEARILQGPFLAPLWPILKAWRLRTGGRGLLLPPALTATPKRRVGAFMHPRRLAKALEAVAPATAEWAKPWYQSTRHTFATHWMRAGHPLGELALVLGHSATFVTERYAHIRAGTERDDPWTMDLAREPEVVEIGPRMGPDEGQPATAVRENTQQ